MTTAPRRPNIDPIDAADWPRIEWVCLGRRFTEGKLYIRMAHASDLNETAMLAVNKRTRRFYSGAVFSVETKESRIRPGTARFLRIWSDAACRAGWQAESDIAEAEQAVAKEEAAGRRLVSMAKLLEPLREVYSRAPYRRRVALEVLVLNALRMPVHHVVKEADDGA